MLTATRPRTGPTLLQTVQQAISSARHFMLPANAQAYLMDLYCRGLQNVDSYDPSSGEVTLMPEDGHAAWEGYNLYRGTLTDSKSMLLESTPKREAKPISPEIEAIESAKLAKIVIDDFWHRFKIEKQQHICADAYIKSGACIASFVLDPTKGEIIGRDPITGKVQRAGQLIPRWDTKDQWIPDPRARNVEECEWAIRLSVQPTEKACQWFPKHADKIRSMETVLGDSDLLQSRLMNSTQWQRRGANSLIKGRGLVVVVEWYGRANDDEPDGTHEMFVGSTAVPSLQVTDYGSMPKWMGGDLPLEVGVQDVSSHCFWGNGTFMTDLIPAGREINKRAHQETLCADAIGNPKIAIPSPGGVLNAHLSNDPFSPFIPCEPGQYPQVLPAPQMGDFVKSSKEFALQMFGAMAPASPVDRGVAQKTTSGFHAAIIDEENRRSNFSFIVNWRDFWNGTTKKYYKFWKSSTVYPQQLRGIGSRGEAIFRRISGLDIQYDCEVGIVEGSMEPQNRVAAFAQWSDLLGKGVGNPMTPIRPEIEQRMWSDIGKGDMTATWRDLEAPKDNADDILVRLIRGEPFVPRLQDDPEICFSVIRSYMQTDQYRGRLLRDPHLEMRLTAALDRFGEMLMAKQMAQMQAQVAAAGQPGTPGFGSEPNAVQEASKTNAPGSPQGGRDGKAFQGIGTVPNPNRDQGGNPG